MTAAGPLLGVQSVEFKATGQLLGKTISTVRPFDFAGVFVWDPNRSPSQQNHDALRISDLTRVVYENDYTSPSTSVEPNRSFFYIVSNTDGANSIVDFADRGRYWRSKVTQGAAWNDINSTEAVNNARAAFPDDYYEFTVTAKDAAGLSKDKTQRVLLDNWEQTVNAPVILDPFVPPGHVRVRVFGTQFTANLTVKVYAVSTFPADGANLSAAGQLLGTAPTDADGNIIDTDFVFLPAGQYYIVADYHGGDGIYQPRLDAIIGPYTQEAFLMGATIQMAGLSAASPPGGPVPRATQPTGGRSDRVEVNRLSNDLTTFHGTRADAPAPSELAVAVPESPADPLKLPGELGL